MVDVVVCLVVYLVTWLKESEQDYEGLYTVEEIDFFLVFLSYTWQPRSHPWVSKGYFVLKPPRPVRFLPFPIGCTCGLEAAITVRGLCFSPTFGQVAATWIFPL